MNSITVFLVACLSANAYADPKPELPKPPIVAVDSSSYGKLAKAAGVSSTSVFSGGSLSNAGSSAIVVTLPKPTK